MNAEKKMLMIVNPRAGMLKIRSSILDLIQIFCINHFEVTVYTTKAQGDAVQAVRERASAYDVVVCCGGDGTFNETVSGLMDVESPPALGYIPAGSTNDFAASMKLPPNLLSAANRVLTGTPTKIDIGKFNRRYFSYVASFGAFTESSYETPQNIKNALGHLAYILEGMKDLPNIRPTHMRIEANGEVFEDDYIFGAVSNSTSLGGLLKLDSGVVDMSDGVFEVLLVKFPQTPAEIQKILTGVLKKQYNNDCMTFFPAEKAKFYTLESVPWTLDGEFEEGAEEIEIRNLHHAIQLIL